MGLAQTGTGKTAGRGEGGQTSRSGKGTGVKRGFEGGQMPIHRRLPKRGFINPFRTEMATINIRDLTRFEAGSVIDAEVLHTAGLVPTVRHGVKVLGMGELDRVLTVRVQAFSEGARKKIEIAGGQAELVSSQVDLPKEPGQTPDQAE